MTVAKLGVYDTVKINFQVLRWACLGEYWIKKLPPGRQQNRKNKKKKKTKKNGLGKILVHSIKGSFLISLCIQVLYRPTCFR